MVIDRSAPVAAATVVVADAELLAGLGLGSASLAETEAVSVWDPGGRAHHRHGRRCPARQAAHRAGDRARERPSPETMKGEASIP